MKAWSMWVVFILLLQRESAQEKSADASMPIRAHSAVTLTPEILDFASQAPRTASHPKTALSPILAIRPCAYVHSRLRHRLYRDRHLQRHFAAGSELYYRGYIRACGHRSQVGDHHHHRF